MNSVISSSVAKKFVMALAGAFLLLFLPVHLSINLLLLKTDPGPFNNAAHFMATFPVVRIVEIVLISAILIHIAWGLFLQIQNWLARPVRYAAPNRSETVFFSRFMIWTGACVLTFFIIHWSNFWFIRLGFVQGNAEDFYNVAHDLFKIPVYNIIYLACFALLGLHLFHAFTSAFQTLGLNNPFWKPVLKTFAWIYSIVLPLGFATISFTLWQFR
jgi:succinate dehydrogenase / fumarate reductase cytochrome b subunit